MRIMYVEDNQVNLGLVVRIAKMGNHEVINFPDGTEALKALETEPVDLILMDIELEGELDGIEVVKRLRARGDMRPIVAITAYAMVGDKERILEAGCDDYLPKPLPVAQFLNILSRYDPAKDGIGKVTSKPEAKKPAKVAAKPVSETKSDTASAPTAGKSVKDEAVNVDKMPDQESEGSVVPTSADKTEDLATVANTEKTKPAAETKQESVVKNGQSIKVEPQAEAGATIKEPERDPEATIPFDPEQLEAEIKAEHEASEHKKDSVNDQSAELQAERESHDKPDKI